MGFNKAALKSLDLHSKEVVEMPEWGQSIGIRTLSSDDRFNYEKLFAKGVDGLNSNYQVKLVALCAVDPETGEHVFPSVADIELLGSQPAYLIERLYKVAQKLNKLTKEEVEKAEKNSEKTEIEGSSSD